MSRRNRLLSWLAAILALVGLAYASLPWLLETVVRHALAAQGLRDIRLRVEYPRWQGLRLHGLAFTTVSANQQIRVQVPTVEIGYHLSELVSGQVGRLRVPVATLHIQSVPVGAASSQVSASGQSVAALPLATLVSGQWLTQLPFRELSLQRLSVNWQAATNTEYALQLSAQLRDAQLQLHGDLSLPPLPKPIAFSVTASHTGKAHLLISARSDAAKPLLTVAVTSVDVEQDPMIVNGELHTRLKPWLPMLSPWLKRLKQVSGLDAELDSQWSLRIKDSTWQLTGKARLHGLAGQWRDLAATASEATARFSADAQHVTLHSSLSTAGQAVVLQAEAVHQFASGRGHAELELKPVVFTKSGFVLSHLLQAWPYPVDVDAGRASATVQLQWHKMLTAKLDLELDKLGGHYNKMTFSGLSGEMALAMDKGIATRKAAHVHIDVFDVGLPVENINAQFALALPAEKLLPVVRVKKFSAALLGGRAHTEPFTLDFARDRNAFEVELEHIGLNEILRLEQQEGLAGSGLLDGKIPITVSRQGIEVMHGQLAVRAPGGVIRYTPTPKVASLAQTNPSVNLVVEALRNFHYQVMAVQANYKTKGDLDLQVHLEGKNPDWQAGKPVHLNLNLQENIPVLLRSLQLSGEIGERVRQHYQNPP